MGIIPFRNKLKNVGLYHYVVAATFRLRTASLFQAMRSNDFFTATFGCISVL